MSAAPEPVFEAPWHAQVFAMTVHLNETGLFAWDQWAQRFGATLARHRVDRDLDGGEDYFVAWLETLEGFLAELSVADAAQVEKLRAAWEEAYLSTPHGAPVRLADGAVG
ncbi:nitrile hydratase accessory protein [Sulfitobacter aestuariivivens]|uniref:Nitrile hydratase accessory protein n=1 Tax=Sulfitobacter aestuariivivens TaxID=2766981 RepID=A0A927D3W7_9RHOB|nr:nitrile hydratase accessory protein [Sulfitobacter aestuariivivens]MBD3662371.1 nitrile hydratase accessory protein [Sulfitobacter aestuariivivens]